MARNQKLTVDLEANDKLSPKIEKADKEVRALDGKKADVEIGADTSGIDDALDALDGKIGGLGSKFGGLTSPAGGVAALAGGLLLAADHAADLAIEADNIASLTGDSVEEASQLNAVWKQTGADTKDLQDVLLQMNGVLATDADLAKELGVNLEDGATVGQRFKQVAAALDEIPDAAKRSQIASRVFGEEGVRQYNALRQSVGDLSTAMENVPAGSVISEEDVKNARRAKQQIKELKAEFLALAGALGSVVIPGVTGAFNAINGLFEGARNWGETTRAIFTEFSLETENQRITREFEQSNEAAAEFDRTLLDGLTTFEQVRAKVLELTDSQHAANLVAIEWADAHNAATDSTDELTSATIRQTEAESIYRQQAREVADEMESKTIPVLAELEEAERRAAEKADAHRLAVEATAEALERQYDAAIRLVGGDIAVREAQRDAADAVDQLNEVNADAEATDRDKARAADNAAEAQLRAAQAAADYRADQMTANGESVTATVQAQLFEEELTNLTAQLNGPLYDALLKYIEQLQHIPDQITTEVKALYTAQLVGASGRIIDAPGADQTRGSVNPNILTTDGVALPATAGPRTINNNFYVQNLTPEKVVDAVRRYDRFNPS